MQLATPPDAGATELAHAIDRASNVVFFGGAGVSTESGIPDFRSEAGLYHAQETYGYPPETLLSHGCLLTHPELFFRYYRENLLHTEAKPNAAHRALAELEATGKLAAVITQNIDGLHQAAGSKRVFELHGSIWRNYCVQCGAHYPLEYILDPGNCTPDGIPLCAQPNCQPALGSASDPSHHRDVGVPARMVRPDVVLYGEGLDDRVVHGAITAIANADLLIVGGTSLAVYPAAGLLEFFRGSTIAMINKSATDLDKHADILITEPIGEVFTEVMSQLSRTDRQAP